MQCQRQPVRGGLPLLVNHAPKPCAQPQPAHPTAMPTCYVIEYRHTSGKFQPSLLDRLELKHCVEPRHVQGGPVVFVQNPEHHRRVFRAARRLFPRHVVVEEPLLELVTSIADGIWLAERRRKVNEKSRWVLKL